MRSSRIRPAWLLAIAAALALLAPAAARAQEHEEHEDGPRHLAHVEEHGGFPEFVDVFFTHHAYLERKFHPRVEATLADEEREYEASGEIVWRFGERLGTEIEAGVIRTDPEEGDGATGLGDTEVAPYVALVQNPEALLIVSLRSGFVLPTGDEEQGLGEDGWGWEPGFLVWKGFGAEERGAIQVELGYDRLFADEGRDEEELVYNLALTYWLPSNWIPIVELNGSTPVGNGNDSEDTLVAGVLGFRYAFANEQQWGAGIQLPLNGDAYDLRLVVGGIIHFE